MDTNKLIEDAQIHLKASRVLANRAKAFKNASRISTSRDIRNRYRRSYCHCIRQMRYHITTAKCCMLNVIGN